MGVGKALGVSSGHSDVKSCAQWSCDMASCLNTDRTKFPSASMSALMYVDV